MKPSLLRDEDLVWTGETLASISIGECTGWCGLVFGVVRV